MSVERVARKSGLAAMAASLAAVAGFGLLGSPPSGADQATAVSPVGTYTAMLIVDGVSQGTLLTIKKKTFQLGFGLWQGTWTESGTTVKFTGDEQTGTINEMGDNLGSKLAPGKIVAGGKVIEEFYAEREKPA